jgi:hypothetical protein
MTQRKRCQYTRQTEFGPAQCVYRAEPGADYCKGHLTASVDDLDCDVTEVICDTCGAALGRCACGA